ncbi:MAG: hypothetical protein ACE10D_07275 [Planctomycetota bacterium]|nr:hypothetical protein [Planctomycetota bacterium]
MTPLNRLAAAAAALLLLPPGAAAGPEAATPDTLKAEVEALRVADVAWRRIPWKSCLVEGLQESRRLNKPLMLWVFIDRPVDDTRC